MDIQSQLEELIQEWRDEIEEYDGNGGMAERAFSDGLDHCAEMLEQLINNELFD